MTGLFSDEPGDSGASLSEDGVYRFLLWRILAASGPRVLFVGVNPSTADALKEDPTTKLWRIIANALGASRYEAVNIFAFRAAEVAELAKAADAVGGARQADEVYAAFARADIIVPCWGPSTKVPKPLRPQFAAMESAVFVAKRQMGKRVLVLGLTKEGYPRHPLYQDPRKPLVEWEGRRP